MKYHYTDWPKFIPLETYHEAIGRMVKKVEDAGIAEGIYQVGSVGSPGISDVDLVVVLKEGVKTKVNPTAGLEPTDRYLFSHRLFGTVIPYALNLESYVFFGNYKLLSGQEFNLANFSLTSEEERRLKYQIALEYLIKAWISIAISVEIKIVQVRNLLLHAKGILHDIRFLELKNTRLEQCIHKIVATRDHWFEKPLTEDQLDVLVDEYKDSLHETVMTGILKHKFYLHPYANLQISKRIFIKQGDNFTIKRKGILLPINRRNPSPKIRKINNLLNKFEVSLPYTQDNVPDILARRHLFLREVFQYNKNHLPGFISTGHGLDTFSSLK